MERRLLSMQTQGLENILTGERKYLIMEKQKYGIS